MTARRHNHRSPFALAALALLGGCMVGPTYRGPPGVAPRAETAAAYRRSAVAPVTDEPPLARWWLALGDDTLDGIETDALANSPTLERALGVVREARATVRESSSALLPQGGANAVYARVGIPGSIDDALGGAAGGGAAGASGGSGTQLPENLSLYNVGLLATWEVDLFGGTRRQIASARASLEASQARLEDAQVTLTKDVATAYVNLRDAQARLTLARHDAEVQARMLDLTRRRRLGGTATDIDVERVFAQLKRTEATAVPLAGQVEVYTDQLSQLAGHEPGALDAALAAPRPLPLPPEQSAIGRPADLLRRRPDIRAAERRLAASSEDIGASIARYFPTVNLYGTIGYGSTRAAGLFDGGNLLKLAAPVLSWNFLGFPMVKAQVEESRGRFDQARASYRSTILSALLDAENALSRFGHQRDNVVSLAEASASAARAAAKADIRFRGGTTTLIDALDAERQRVETQSNLAQAQAMLTTDWIGLQSSLGLGWGVVDAGNGAKPVGRP
ncbi:efflux transporter outer membrane subunit [Sphingomonas bacterium]|uniref:efflux transporter outer membrane subunit n=1 Tax=Sphingomonas bacterium TaxID=1895847 RepID=UPI0015757B51|nr:TolC family protein [Sphingomonas bacterium]